MSNIEFVKFGYATVKLTRMHQDLGIGELQLLGPESNKAKLCDRVEIDLTGNVVIGEYSLISEDVKLFTHKHSWPSKAVLRRDCNFVTFWPLVIGKDVFIGVNAIVVGAARIGDGAIIGAGAVVTHDIPAYEKWAGNPARRVGVRI